MEEYPSNSHSSKGEISNEQKRPKVEQIVTDGVIRQKKPLGRRFVDSFIKTSGRAVITHVVWDVLVPRARDAAVDGIQEGAFRLFYGESQGTSKRGRRSVGQEITRTAYESMFEDPRGPAPQPRMSRQARRAHDFDEIVLASRAQAQSVIGNLFTLVEEYGVAKVADLYDMIGETPGHTDERYGWEDLRGAQVVHVRNGYLLDLPRPIPLGR